MLMEDNVNINPQKTRCGGSDWTKDGARGRGSGLRHCVTSRKVAGSIPEGVIGIFH